MNFILNIGLNDKKSHKQEMDTDTAINMVGQFIGNCTITTCVGFYMGERETSLKVEIYGISVENAVGYAAYFADILNQECIALTAGDNTVFVYSESMDEYASIINTLKAA